MAALLVTYDLMRTGQAYDEVDRYLKTHDTYWRFLQSTWLITTAKTPDRVRDELSRLADANDKLFVVDISGDAAAWRGFAPHDDWLTKTILRG